MSWHPSTGGPSPSRTCRLRALVMMALLAFASVTTGLAVHSHREVLSAELAHHAMAGEMISLAAVHPGATPHWEAGGIETTFRCPVCLLHLQTAGAAAADAVAPVALAPDGRLTALGPEIPHAASRLPGGSRAPPASR